MGITHIAGQPILIGRVLRQRCAWCGAVITEYDLERTESLLPEEGEPVDRMLPGTWPQAALISMDGNASWVVAGNTMPADACGKIDPAVTR